MQTKPFGIRFALFFGIIALALGAWAVVYLLRPLAVVTPATKGRAVSAVPGSVTVYAEYQMELKSEIGGRVTRSELTLGRTVRQGDLLVSIDTGDLELEIERLESEFAAHKQRVAVGSSIALELENVRDELKNLERMVKRGTSSEVELTRQQRMLKQVEQRAALEAVENNQKSETYENLLKVKRRQFEKMTIVAPFDGVISSLNAWPGDLIGSNAPVATIITTSRKVEAKVSEENFAGIKLGQKASIRFLGYGSQLYEASVIKILPTADAETQRYIIHLSVDLPVEKLVPGLTGEVSIIIGERDAAVIIPRRALRGSEVLVVKDGAVEMRKLRLGYVGLNQAEILEGLAEGELVVLRDFDRFRDGERVRILLDQ